MASDLSAYIPQDRRRALAHGASLPDRASGAALFADVTGFTPLAEALARAHGPRRGAEELTALLNQVYDALLARVDRFGGSVVSFSGDAITCWFDDAERLEARDWRLGERDGEQVPSLQPPASGAALRALACALAMTQAMAAFAAPTTLPGAPDALAVKVAIASGAVRRFLIGDPNIQLLDTLAGDTLDRLSAIAHLAEHADVIADERTVAAIGAAALVGGWREDAQTARRAAVIAALKTSPEAASNGRETASEAAVLNARLSRTWLSPAVYARLKGSAESFLAELRPAAALMLQFGGFDYERDDAGGRLDAYIRQVQQIVTRYEGILVDLTMADKGGYLYAAFGAPVAHEDDAWRAVCAARKLLAIATPARIGLGYGTMRAGPYGSATRRAYGVLGDDVNLACRLMSHAAPGEVLASGGFCKVAGNSARWLALPAIQLKGKREPAAIYRLLAVAPSARPSARPGTRMIGRTAERATLAGLVEALRGGAGRVVTIEGEPGIGKSRLIAETVYHAAEQDVALLTGTGQSTEQQTPYRAWREIFRSYFQIGQIEDPFERQTRVQSQAAATAPELIERLPLLNDLLNIQIPIANPVGALDASQRGASLDDLLIELLRARALAQPLIVVLEDAQWLDTHSWELVARLALAIERGQLALLMVIALRALDSAHPAMPSLIGLLHLRQAQRIVLSALPADETVWVAAARLGLERSELPEDVAGLVGERAGGNPFFAEELVAALRDQGRIHVQATHGRQRCFVSGDLHEAGVALPDTLQGLILSRIDRLSPEERLTLHVASVIGPTFGFEILYALRAHQSGIAEALLKDQLRNLAALDFTWLETPAPQLAYRFKHILTQEAAYQSLLYAQRREIHRRAADWHEQRFGGQESGSASAPSPNMALGLSPYLAILAYHCRQAEDPQRERYYTALLGEQAISIGAFAQAIGCFERALALTPAGPVAQRERGRLTAQLARAHALIGRLADAERLYRESCALAEAAADQVGAAGAAYELGALADRRAAPAEALGYLEQSLELYRAAMDQAGEGRALNRLGALYIELGDEARALACYQQAILLGNSSRQARLR